MARAMLAKCFADISKHPRRAAAGASWAAVAMSASAIDLIGYDLGQRFDAGVSEGQGFDVVDVVDPQHAVFGLELSERSHSKSSSRPRILAAIRIV
jgi:hypothetical protein